MDDHPRSDGSPTRRAAKAVGWGVLEVVATGCLAPALAVFVLVGVVGGATWLPPWVLTVAIVALLALIPIVIIKVVRSARGGSE